MADDLGAVLADYRRRTKSVAVGAALVPATGDAHIEVLGTCARDNTDLVRVDDAWHIGSCTKSITALLYGMLVEQGKASWETSIADLFPDLSGINPGWANPTIEDLLLCRAGVAPNPPMAEMRELHRDSRPGEQQRTAWAQRTLADPPADPGTFVYSNLGYIVAGAAIDRIAAQPFEHSLVADVLEPLGVTSAGFGPPDRIRGHAARARLGPLSIGVGRADGRSPFPADNPPLFTPAGRLHLSLPDWARVQQVFLNHGAPPVNADTIERLFRLPESPPGKPTMSMGWTPAHALGGFRAMQGSNTMWVATAVISKDQDRTALVVANDGRSKSFRTTVQLAARLLTRS